jgi:hypothetical protein
MLRTMPIYRLTEVDSCTCACITFKRDVKEEYSHIGRSYWAGCDDSKKITFKKITPTGSAIRAKINIER